VLLPGGCNGEKPRGIPTTGGKGEGKEIWTLNRIDVIRERAYVICKKGFLEGRGVKQRGRLETQ